MDALIFARAMMEWIAFKTKDGRNQMNFIKLIENEKYTNEQVLIEYFTKCHGLMMALTCVSSMNMDGLNLTAKKIILISISIEVL